MIFLGLRANLVLYVVVVLMAAMALVDVAVTTAAKHLFIQAEKKKAAGLLALAGSRVTAADGRPDEVIATVVAATQDQDEDPRVAAVAVVDAAGWHGLWGRDNGPWGAAIERLAAQAIARGRTMVEFHGRTWGVFKPEPQFLLLATPLGQEGRSDGAAVAVCRLDAVYGDLRQLQAILLIYMGINALVLTFVVYRRFHTLVFKPMTRLVNAAEEYHPEDEMAFGLAAEKTPFGRLSASLNQMLQRIARDKERLQAMVASLEEANRQLYQAHQKILRAEKLALAGRLSAGIAHEIGNPLSIAMGYLGLVRKGGVPEAQRDDFLRRTEVEVNRIHGIIGRLLDLARPSSGKRRVVSLHQIIDRAGQLVQNHPLMAGIDLVIDPAAAHDTVMADGDQLHQVMLNLLLNAADAIATGTADSGRVVITTDNPVHEAGGPAEWLRVRISDNGVGIDADRLALVFDPFYTTKDPGKGTGLGLAVSLTIVEAHGGALTVDSRPGEGATFTVELPLTETAAEP